MHLCAHDIHINIGGYREVRTYVGKYRKIDSDHAQNMVADWDFEVCSNTRVWVHICTYNSAVGDREVIRLGPIALTNCCV